MLERYNKMKLIRMSDKPVLEPIKDHQWEKAAVFNAAMVHVNGVFHMIYRATTDIGGHDKYGHYINTLGYAVSKDLLTWHNWGNNQAFALLEVYKVTGDSACLASVKVWADSFVPFLDKVGFPNNITVDFNGNYITETYPQIAYGFNSLYHGMKTLANMTGEKKYELAAENIFAWFIGQNKAGFSMYDIENGRCYDGIDGERSINMNSGAETTIECLSAIQMRGEQ